MVHAKALEADLQAGGAVDACWLNTKWLPDGSQPQVVRHRLRESEAGPHPACERPSSFMGRCWRWRFPRLNLGFSGIVPGFVNRTQTREALLRSEVLAQVWTHLLPVQRRSERAKGRRVVVIARNRPVQDKSSGSGPEMHFSVTWGALKMLTLHSAHRNPSLLPGRWGILWALWVILAEVAHLEWGPGLWPLVMWKRS